jgi:hypothetical protein
MAFRTIAPLFILFTLLINSSTQAFARNFMLGAMINREFFLLSFQSLLKIFAVLLKQDESIIPKFVSVLPNKCFQSDYRYKCCVEICPCFIQPVFID